MGGVWSRTSFTISSALHNHTHAIEAIEDFLIAVGWERASWSGSGTDRHYLRANRILETTWKFTGDGTAKHAGIRVVYDATPNASSATGLNGHASFSGQTHIVLQSFLQSGAQNGVEVHNPDFVSNVADAATTTPRFGTVRLKYDNTVNNNYLLIGGEDGLYVEVGEGAHQTNLGHGAVMSISAIEGFGDPYAYKVAWTSAGVTCDFYGRCRFTESRNTRFVKNDGTNRNFTARLKPYSPRGTWSLATQQIQNQWPYYIGSLDTFIGMGNGSSVPADDTPSLAEMQANANLAYLATFGLLNTPQNGQYRISPMVLIQSLERIAVGVDSTNASDTVAANTTSYVLEPRTMRRLNRFVVLDHTLAAGSVVADAASGKLYRVAAVDDGGRSPQIGVEWPSGSIAVNP